jgi:hypothetical protein
MYFPFFTYKVKCGAAALDIADQQNAHSMTLAVRSVVELHKAVKREQELHREILAFSISEDHWMIGKVEAGKSLNQRTWPAWWSGYSVRTRDQCSVLT